MLRNGAEGLTNTHCILNDNRENEHVRKRKENKD